MWWSGPGKAYQAAVDFHSFSTDPAVKASALHSAADGLVQLRRLVGYNTPDDEAVWQLMGGPLRFVLGYTEEQASCSLQGEWASKVDWPLQTAPNMTAMVDQLYGAKGTVWAFADGPAKPFLQRDANRFAIVQTLGYSVPFTRQFLPMLNDAAGKRVEQLVTQQRAELQDQTDKLAGQKEQLQTQQALAQVDRVLADIKQKVDAIKAQALQLTHHRPAHQRQSRRQGQAFCHRAGRAVRFRRAGHQQLQLPRDRQLPAGRPPVRRSHAADQDRGRGAHQEIPGLHRRRAFPAGLPGRRAPVQRGRIPVRPSARLDALGVRQIGLRYNFEGQDAILKAAQQLELLDRQEKEKTAEKQRLQDAQFAREERGIQAKLSNATSVPAIEVSLPKQIGVCWDTRMTPHKPQDTQAMFKELAAAQVLARQLHRSRCPLKEAAHKTQRGPGGFPADSARTAGGCNNARRVF
jgi:type VI secretion system protein ImpL